MASFPHRIRVGSLAGQFGSPSERDDARLRSATGIDINHGWKIHADFAESLSTDQAYGRMGRSATGAITDPKAAKSFDALLGKVGMSYDDFSKAFFFKPKTDGANAGVKGLTNGQMQYIDPIATAKTMGIMEDLGMQYKLSAGNYGSGRHLTAYPQTLERRDQVISALEQGLGTSLQDQNDPAFRSGINAATGIKNAPLSRGVSGRFTTDYLATKADGSPDFSIPGTETGGDPGLLVSGMVSEDQAQTINRVLQTEPRMAEILHGKPGYKTPYKTIDQVFEDRVTGKTPTTRLLMEQDGSPYGITGKAGGPITTAISGTKAPTAGKDMLALGRSLHPDFEKNMPASVRDAFEQGRIKTIFRTDSTTLPVGSKSKTGPVDPGSLSIYAVDDKGAIARFGKGGAGWTGDPRMTGTTEKTTDATAFADEVRYVDTPTKGGNAALRRDRDSLSTEIGVGKRPVEFDGRGGVHEGSGITDFYHSSGEASVGGAVAGLSGESKRAVHKVKDFETEIKIKDGRPTIDLVETSTGTRADAPAEKPKAVIETTPNGKPTIKVGTPVQAQDPARKTPIKAGKPINQKAEEVLKETKNEGTFDQDDSGSEDAVATAVKDIKDVAESEGTLGEALTEKAKEKVTDKIDPIKKIQEAIDNKVGNIKEGLLDTVMDSSNAERAKRLASADPSPVSTKATAMLTRLTNASGRAPGSADTLLGRGAREAIDVISKPGVTRELLESGGDIARAIAGGTKNSKNLRLAGAATLLSAAGYGIGKLRNIKSSPNKERLQASPDDDAALRQSLLNDG